MKKARDFFANRLLFLFIAWLIQLVTQQLKSNSLQEFLDENLITLLFALLAINAATLSVIMTKLRELADIKYLAGEKADFNNTIRSMKNSIIEQVILIFLSTMALILGGSDLLTTNYPVIMLYVKILGIAIFLNAIQILYDTANSVFIIMKYENEKL